MSKPISKNELLTVFFKQHYFIAIVSFFSGLIYNLLTLLIPVAIGKFYEFNFGFSSHKLRFFEKHSWFQMNDFDSFFWVFLVLIGLRLIFEFVNKYTIGLAGERFSKELRENLFEHQLLIPLSVYEDKGMGKYLLRFSGDMNSARNYLTKGVLRFSQDIILLIILLISISIFDWKIMLIISIGFGAIMLLLLVLNRIVRKVSTQVRNSKSGLLSFVNIRLRAVASIIALNRLSPENKRFGSRSQKIYNIGKTYQQVTSLIYALIPAATYLVIGVLMYYFFHYKQELSAGGLLALILIIISFLPTFRRVLRVGVVWEMGNISFKKLIRVFNIANIALVVPSDKIENVNSLELQDVHFHYENQPNSIISGITEKFDGTGTYLIRARHGTGKSTLIKLLLSIYKPVTGKILINDVSITGISDFEIRKNITVVSKDYPLYGDSVYESIVYARNKERKERAGKMLDKLQAHLPSKLKMTLNMKIGELGSKLTNSQNMLLMYCRAFLSNKPVILIEDSFKEFNVATRDLIFKRINRMADKKLVIVFTNTTPDTLKIKKEFTLEKGRILSV